MAKIELIGYLNERGQLEFTFELPAGYPPGEVRIVVDPPGAADQIAACGDSDPLPDEPAADSEESR